MPNEVIKDREKKLNEAKKKLKKALKNLTSTNFQVNF